MSDLLSPAPNGTPGRSPGSVLVSDAELLAGLGACVAGSRLVAESSATAGDVTSIDGVAARAVCAPADLDEVARVLAWVAENSLSVAPIGSGSKLDLGNPPSSLDVVVSTARLNRVIEYEPADLTLTVQAGIGLAEVQRVLAESGQFLPIDPPFADRATVGGILATNSSGPLRLRFGSARDVVIGTRTVNPTGLISKTGGKVVKNVTGYDLNKLYIGALGTLGIVGEVTFKVQPLPKVMATVVAGFADVASATAAANDLIRSPLAPAAVVVLDPTTTADAARAATVSLPAGYLLVLLAAGFDAPVARQVAGTTEAARSSGATDVQTLAPGDGERLWGAIREFAARSPGGLATLVRIAVPISQTAALLHAVEESRDCTTSSLIHAGTGLVFAWLSRPDTSSDAASTLVAALRRLRGIAREHEGTLVVERCPRVVKDTFDVWDDPGDALAIMRRIKGKLDPARILNPGRFVGGI